MSRAGRVAWRFRLPGRWWWRTLLGGRPPIETTVVETWISRPDFVPPAAAELARRGLAVRFACALSESACDRLTRAVAAAYGLPEPLLARAETLAELNAALRAPSIVGSAEPVGQSEAGRRTLDLVPELQSGPFRPGQQHFLAQTLLLGRAPAEARRIAAAVLDRRCDPWPPPFLDAPMPATERTWRTTKPEPTAGTGVARPKRRQAAWTGGEHSVPPPDPGRRTAGRPNPGCTAVPDHAPETPGRIEFASSPAPEAAAAHAPLPHRHAVATGHGGLLYLLNLLLRLDVYGDFTSPNRPGLTLSPWDAIALLGERLTGPSLRADPLWMLLAVLAGRDPVSEPGQGFTAPETWWLPPAWLDAFPGPRSWRWHADSGRLTVRDTTAGFVVLDVPWRPGRPPSAVLASMLRPYRQVTRFTLRRERRPSRRRPGITPLDRWLGWLVSYARPRLCHALGERDPARVAGLLCRHDARIEVSPARLEAVFDLAAHPLAIRLAGLDRDPGWIPAVGRAVAFHYELRG